MHQMRGPSFELPNEPEELTEPQELEERLVFDFPGGELEMPKSWFLDRINTLYPKLVEDSTNNPEIIKLYILRNIGEEITKQLQLPTIEALHEKPIWKQIVKIINEEVNNRK